MQRCVLGWAERIVTDLVRVGGCELNGANPRPYEAGRATSSKNYRLEEGASLILMTRYVDSRAAREEGL